MARQLNMLEVNHLQRLKEGQEKALLETDIQIEHWKKFHSDYVALQKRLKTLPHKTTHEVMVPFGSVAFIPGQLVHTNEILVLLGDNYFLERSATQAVDIVSRRLKELDKNVESLQKQRELLVPRVEYTQEMMDMAANYGDVQEINEEYDEEQEKKWREQHRTFLRQAGQRQRAEMEKKKQLQKGEAGKTDEDCWEILERLELQERKNKELAVVDEEDSDSLHSEENTDHADEDDTNSSSPDDGGNVTEDGESADDEDLQQTQKTITFSHTKQQNEESHISSPGISDDGTPVINSPADLYRIVKMAPKSILKSQASSQERKVTFAQEHHQERHTEEKRHNAIEKLRFRSKGLTDWSELRDEQNQSLKSAVKAFSETVVEREVPAMTGEHNLASPGTPSPVPEVPPVRHPVSKFRATRQQQGINTSCCRLQPHEVPDHVESTGTTSQGQDSVSSRPVSKFRASRQKQTGGS